jgi:hypothetical protein
MKPGLRSILVFVLLVSLASLSHGAPVGTAFTYQGQLQKSGVPVTGSNDFRFSLFDSVTAGSQIGSTVSLPGVGVVNGIFTVSLDYGASAFAGQARWIEIAVKGSGDPSYTTLGPRQPLAATPYALYAAGGPGGGGGFALPYFGAVTSAAQDGFDVQNNATTGSFFAIHGVSASSAASSGAVLGEATGSSGTTLGIYGKATASPAGTGMVGQGSQTGGWFEAFNTTGDGTGLNGVAHTNANAAAGVKGQSLSPSGYVVGVWGLSTTSPDGTGVAGTGGAAGGWFTSNSTNPVPDYAGVYGIASVHPGVKGRSTGDNGVYGAGVNGVFGVANTGSGGDGAVGVGDGAGIGVLGSSTSGPGVQGSSTSGSGAQGSSASGSGVQGSSTSGYGVRGSSTNNYGVYGTTSLVTKAGVIGDTPIGDGVWGQSGAAFKSGVVGLTYNVQGYGGWFQNNAGGVALYANGLAQVKTLQILGADLAESFPVGHERIEPGTVVAIAPEGDGELQVCDEAYCRRVAGIVSGAHGLAAGVVLKGAAFNESDHAAIAMSGRVWVKCDATHSPIHVGDLLTTSDHAGEAMRADDPARAYGSVLGKAMTNLETGTGMVLVLVNLQ